MRTDKCMADQLNKKYINQDFEKIINQSKEKFDKFFEELLNKPVSENN